MVGLNRNYQTLWAGGAPTATVGGTTAIQVGIYVKINVPGRIVGLRFYHDTLDAANHCGWIGEDGTSRSLEFCTFKRNFPASSRPSGWVTGFMHPWYRITSGNTYVLTVIFGAGRYHQMIDAHSGDTDQTIGNFVIPHDTAGRPNGGTNTGIPQFLPTSMGAAKPAIDLYFLPD